jgi:hypothetical protein
MTAAAVVCSGLLLQNSSKTGIVQSLYTKSPKRDKHQPKSGMAHRLLRSQNTHLGLVHPADDRIYISNHPGDPPELINSPRKEG